MVPVHTNLQTTTLRNEQHLLTHHGAQSEQRSQFNDTERLPPYSSTTQQQHTEHIAPTQAYLLTMPQMHTPTAGHQVYLSLTQLGQQSLVQLVQKVIVCQTVEVPLWDTLAHLPYPQG